MTAEMMKRPHWTEELGGQVSCYCCGVCDVWLAPSHCACPADRDAVVPIALRRSTRRRPRSDPHPYHTLEVPAPPLEEGGAVGCHICGQVTEQPPVGE